MGKITATDRLIFTLLFSVIIHLTIVLGVSFQTEASLTNQPKMSLDITLVKQQTEKAPEKADYLAQVNNEGGGETEIKTPKPSPKKIAEQTASSQLVAAEPIANIPPIPAQIDMPNKQDIEPVAKAKIKPVKTPKPKKIVKPKASPTKAIVQAHAKRKINKITEKAKQRQDETAKPTPVSKPARQKLMLPSQNEIADLQRQFDNMAKSLSKRPKKRKISASTKEYAAAAYMKAWEMKVERIGNFNYPQEAKRRGINGNLMLSVDINPDGSVPPDGIVISRSSGYKILDNAAVRIVRLGAPYSDIPKNVLQGNDMLTIIRTWKFETNIGLSTK